MLSRQVHLLMSTCQTLVWLAVQPNWLCTSNLFRIAWEASLEYLTILNKYLGRKYVSLGN